MEKMGAERNVLEVMELSIGYPDGFVMGPVSFGLGEGEILAVIGESGSGKSTLAQAVINLLPDCYSKKSGEVWINGKEVLHETEKNLRNRRMKEFSIVMQNSSELLNPSLTLGIQLYEVLQEKKDREKRAKELMILVGLDEEELGRYPHELSGGMVQRFLLAVALACKPRVVILDEPTSALDWEAREGFINLVRKIQLEQKTAFLLVTHDLFLARELSSRLMVLYKGTVEELGGTKKILEMPLHPYTRGLIGASMELYPLRDMWGIRRGKVTGGLGCPFFGRCTQSIEVCGERLPKLRLTEEAGRTGTDECRRIRCHRGGIVSVLEGIGVKKAYGEHAVLKGADLTVYSGEMVALTGHSGSGKSTYGGILSGFLNADSGELLFGGIPANFGELHRTEGGLQMVFQDSERALNRNMTVQEAVLEPLRIARIGANNGNKGENAEKPLEEMKVRLCTLLRAVDLPDNGFFLSQKIKMLSGGQKQRICIARALMLKPRLLIADEPTAMLDVSSTANLLRMLKGLQNQQGFAMLMITHDRACATKIADRIYNMKDGICEMELQENSVKTQNL